MTDASLPIINHFIGGQATPGQSNRYGDAFNPATGAVQARVPFASTAEVNETVRIAAEAL